MAARFLVICSYANSLAYVDIAAIETPPAARRFEVYGEQGSTILELFESAGMLRLCLAHVHGLYQRGEQLIQLQDRPRQLLYDLELEAFLATLLGERPPDRPPAHDLIVQETLLRATGEIRDA